jgi:hypothetical protein
MADKPGKKGKNGFLRGIFLKKCYFFTKLVVDFV